MEKLFLASFSPRRKELLSNIIKDNFTVVKACYKEEDIPGISPELLCITHSKGKARSVADKLTCGIIIAADTIVVTKDNEVLGKPCDKSDAKKMLTKISGNWVTVCTALCLLKLKTGEELAELEKTRVKIKTLSKEEIETYLLSSEPYDKAGAFGIQGQGGLFVEKIEGCYFNVVGLPLFKLSCLLKKLNVDLLSYK